MLSYTDLAVSVAEADAYAEARLWANWTGTDTVKAAALLRGQSYIASTYNGRWVAEWANDDAPDGVKYAIIEAARRELVAAGSLDPDYDPTGLIKREKKKLGPLEKEFEYAVPVDAASAKPVIGIIDSILASLLIAAPGSTSVTTLARF